MTPTCCPFSLTCDFLSSNDSRILVNVVNFLFYFSVMREGLKKQRHATTTTKKNNKVMCNRYPPSPLCHPDLTIIIIPWVRIGYNNLISNKQNWNDCFNQKAHYILGIFPDFICKNNRFSAYFKFLSRCDSYHTSICRAWCMYDGSYFMMATPIRALELHYPMIQFLITILSCIL